MTSQTFTSDIVNLNVGGTRFSTSRQTLCSVHDSFFSSLLSGRIPSCRDDQGHLFIDRDPKYFSVILNFLRTKELNLNSVDDLSALRAEAEFYAITPLVKRLIICEDLDRSLCGDVLFTGFIPPPHNLNWKQSSHGRASMDTTATTNSTSSNQTSTNTATAASSNSILKPGNVLRLFNSPHHRSTSNEAPTTHHKTHSRQSSSSELLNFVYNYPSAIDFANQHLNGGGVRTGPSHSRNQSMELRQMKTDLGILLTDCTGSGTQYMNRNPALGPTSTATTQVNLIVGHHNWIAVAYAHYVCCYKLKDGLGWQLMFQSNYVDDEIERVSIYSKYHFNHSGNNMLQSNASGSNLAGLVGAGSSASNTSTLAPNGHSSASSLNSHRSSSGSNLLGSLNSNSINGLTSPVNHSAQQVASASAAVAAAFQQPSSPQSLIASLAAAANLDSSPGSVGSSPHYQFSKLCALLAIAYKHTVRLWLVSDEIACNLIGNFNLNSSIEHLFFIGSQLVALGAVGRIGVWNSLSQLWQAQDVITPISSFDTAGSFLLLGGQNGVLYYIDMQKFPLRMKDNDLLVTELYKDPLGEPITALSVYLTPKTTNTGNWIEIAYGTSNGTIRVIVQHPETVGHGPQLFQTFSVHRGAILKVMLTEKYLVSVCSEFNHVRTWNVTRFRGMISTQPGSTPLASFKIVTIDASDAAPSYAPGNDIGPYGERDNIQLFVQKAVPFTDQLYVRVSSTGKRICTIKSVDYSNITSFCVHECEGPSRLNSRPRRYLFTGHSNGTIQLWDLTTALELKTPQQSDHSPQHLGGPSAIEFVKLLDQCDLIVTNSGYSTPTTANCFSPCANLLAGSCISNNNNNTNSKIHKNLLVNSNVNLAHSSSSSSSCHPSNNEDNSSEKRLDD